jgi:hypothetical protein
LFVDIATSLEPDLYKPEVPSLANVIAGAF